MMRNQNRLSLLLRKYSRSLLFLLLLIIAFFVIKKVFSRSSVSPGGQPVKVEKPKKTADINKEFSFPIKNEDGEEVSKIRFKIEKAELRDEIIVKGQRATAIDGRTFLILTIKLTNSFNRSIEIDTRDYIRLSVNKNKKEWLAADIHNDPVQIQAISTKFTRLGFPINDTDKDFVLKIGEIKGKKQKISIKF